MVLVQGPVSVSCLSTSDGYRTNKGSNTRDLPSSVMCKLLGVIFY